MRRLCSWVVLACACTREAELPSSEEAGPVASADLGWSPSSLDFGEVSLTGATDPRQVLVLENTGGASLHLETIALDPADGPFTLVSPAVDALAPGEAAEVAVGFAPPAAGVSRAVLTVRSDDPDEGLVQVAVRATALAPVAAALPSALDLGTVQVGCAGEEELRLGNAGNTPLRLTALLVEGDGAFALDAGALALPQVLQPGAQTEPVLVTARPLADGVAAATLRVESDDPVSPVLEVPLRATGEATAWRTDAWTVGSAARADVLVAFDRTLTGRGWLWDYPELLHLLPVALTAAGLDHRVAVTVEDSGCINGDDLWIDTSFSSSDAHDVVRAMVNLGGSYGADAERSLTLLDAAVAEAVPWGCNPGLLRDGGMWHLVGISDEQDQSREAPSVYVDRLLAARGDPDRVRIHAIGGPVPGGCTHADPFLGMDEAVATTGGTFLSICDGIEANLQAIADEVVAATADVSADLRVWAPSQPPVPDTLGVTLDGVPVASGWTWDGRAVVFDSAPPADQELVLRYAVAPATCE